MFEECTKERADIAAKREDCRVALRALKVPQPFSSPLFSRSAPPLHPPCALVLACPPALPPQLPHYPNPNTQNNTNDVVHKLACLARQHNLQGSLVDLCRGQSPSIRQSVDPIKLNQVGQGLIVPFLPFGRRLWRRWRPSRQTSSAASTPPVWPPMMMRTLSTTMTLHLCPRCLGCRFSQAEASPVSPLFKKC